MSEWEEYRQFAINPMIDGEERNLYVDVRLTLSRDPCYGADADGNRGTDTTFIDEWEIESLWDLDTGTEYAGNWNEKSIRKEIKNAIF